MRDALEALNELNEKDVIAFGSNILTIARFRAAIRNATKSGSEVINALNEGLTPRKSPTQYQLFTDGVDCEILSLGSGDWKKRKIKFTLLVEFLPDEPEIPCLPASNAQSESPLDDIRQMLNEAGQ